MRAIQAIIKFVLFCIKATMHLLMWLVVGVPCAILISLGIAICLIKGYKLDDIRQLLIDDLTTARYAARWRSGN